MNNKYKKNKSPIKRQEQTFWEKFNPSSSYYLYLISTLLLIGFIYSFSLFRDWQTFDERVFYNEDIFPIPTQFSEIAEIISKFVVGYHIESMNTYFSNHLTIRSNPFAASLVVIVSFFFQKNALLYHLLQNFLHVLNSALVWIIFYRCTSFYQPNIKENLKYILISIFTLIWSLHSASTEAILLVTNWGALLTYTICLLLILKEITFLSNNNSKFTKLRFISTTLLFCLTMFLTEYGYTLPLILFTLLTALSLVKTSSLSKSFIFAYKATLPYFIGLFLFILISLGRPDSPLINIFGKNGFQNLNVVALGSQIYIFLERNLWLVPQVFIHFFKLLLFPIKLSTYQSNLTTLANTLIEPYSVFCTISYFLFLISPLILIFIFRKNKLSVISLLLFSFFFSLFPFLQIISPTYCLTADRYCYFPIFFLVLFFFNLLISINPSPSKKNIKLTAISAGILLVLLTSRTLIRIQEWNNSLSLYKSAIKIEKKPLYKGQKLTILASYYGKIGKTNEMEKTLRKSLEEFQKALHSLKTLSARHKNQPITLKIYGLDYSSLLLKAAYGIATIKNDNYQENPKEILSFYEPYIKPRLKKTTTNELALYADLLSKVGDLEGAEKILKLGLKKYPYSSALLYSLANYYLEVKNDLGNAYKILKSAYYCFPNHTETIYKLFKYYEKTNDLPNQAEFAYLLGLRQHSPQSYQRSVQLYLDLNQIKFAAIALKKLIRLSPKDPVTLLLTSRYLDVTGKRSKIPFLLFEAYNLSKARGTNEDIKVTKSILVSLVNVNMHLKNFDLSKKYLKALEDIANLTNEDKKVIHELKTRLSNT